MPQSVIKEVTPLQEEWEVSARHLTSAFTNDLDLDIRTLSIPILNLAPTLYALPPATIWESLGVKVIESVALPPIEVGVGDFVINEDMPPGWRRLLRLRRRERALVDLTPERSNAHKARGTIASELVRHFARDVLRQWNINDVSLAALVVEQLRWMPITLYGSPPSTWTSLGAGLQGARYITVVAYAAHEESSHPVIAIITGGSAVILWMVRPTAKVVRRTLAQKVATALGGQYKDEDEK